MWQALMHGLDLLKKALVCRVTDLLDEHGAWMLGLPQQYFLLAHVAEIVKIHGSPRLGDDALAWEPECGGVFLVRIMYRLVLDERLPPSPVPVRRAPYSRLGYFMEVPIFCEGAHLYLHGIINQDR